MTIIDLATYLDTHPARGPAAMKAVPLQHISSLDFNAWEFLNVEVWLWRVCFARCKQQSSFVLCAWSGLGIRWRRTRQS